MFEIRQTEVFSSWLQHLRDRKARSRIFVRIDRLRIGLAGDVKPVGGGISELRIDYGPGYRIYFTKRGNMVIFLLVGGSKSTQKRDIKKARKLAEEL